MGLLPVAVKRQVVVIGVGEPFDLSMDARARRSMTYFR